MSFATQNIISDIHEAQSGTSRSVIARTTVYQSLRVFCYIHCSSVVISWIRSIVYDFRTLTSFDAGTICTDFPEKNSQFHQVFAQKCLQCVQEYRELTQSSKPAPDTQLSRGRPFAGSISSRPSYSTGTTSKAKAAGRQRRDQWKTQSTP